MHVSAVLRNPETYEHVSPDSIGNARKVLISELAGAPTSGLNLPTDMPILRILRALKPSLKKFRIRSTPATALRRRMAVSI